MRPAVSALCLPLAALLAASLAGCGGSGEPESARPSPSAPTARPTPPLLNGVRPGAEKKSQMDGTWTAGSGSRRVALFLYRGAAALNSPGFCTGTVDAKGRIKLSCANGSRERLDGRAALRSGKLVVTWTGGPEDVLHRRAG
ncbi:hypothetical protein [Actinomadura citrea]|jgi:hypothetical protein|uniref:Lipoprotein n=1 Tax=Actinomadura citrea TaxID=46158 RepID=A0A7Y9KIY4_9ACTN|nr:hypothetical protein [Actinomadura citrea]NYE17214.1 hypothetical protein [Actinomadura citrea]GGT92461.1 hypothetical protein GCM10010177_59670 [Actinomadura citrea]